ncbi:hypothetical protein [Hymenobacter swuensis]|uniref:Outer membrane protein beta-barrel domain-containing protein n=1 Tax=Hymenobacter swuensis DY53 TaxID=1227739 RepID=W8F167_9BACT|nr:hypothetical protein [Hymenobacter swuensis]AHJ99139.1 hypothetical protein Hsw_3544 [Hymenobacter swuensis DY53]
MRLPVFLLTAAVVLTLATSTHAQRRTAADLAFQPQVQAEVALKGDDYVYVAFNLVRTNYSSGTFAGGQLRAGYEHFWNTQWSGGGRIFVTRYDDAVLEPEVFARHWNTIGQVNFRQRLGLRYNIPFNSPTERALASLRLDVDRIFPLGSSSVALRPRVAFEPVAYLRFQREDFEAKEPFLDFSELRGEVGVRLSPRFDFTPWFSWQNTYSIALPQYNADGTVKIPGGNTRFVQPTLGLDLRLTLGNQAGAAERRQLPTQY